METKTCEKCKIEKEIHSYYKPKNRNHRRICRSCTRLIAYEWRKNNPDKYQTIQHKYWLNNKEELSSKSKQKRAENYIEYSNRRKELSSQRKLKRYNGIVEKLTIDQNNSCAICKLLFTTENPIDIDHDHMSGNIRGLLCRKCNSGLHYLEKLEVVESMLKYLESYPAKKYPQIKY